MVTDPLPMPLAGDTVTQLSVLEAVQEQHREALIATVLVPPASGNCWLWGLVSRPHGLNPRMKPSMLPGLPVLGVPDVPKMSPVV